MPGAQILGLRREAEERVYFALLEQLDRLYLGVGDPVDVLARVEPDLGRDQGQQLM